jgi:DNA mismatch repair ATPase MutS
MAQYLEIKEANPGCLLFFRMGDFFELFFDDAVAAAQAPTSRCAACRSTLPKPTSRG